MNRSEELYQGVVVIWEDIAVWYDRTSENVLYTWNRRRSIRGALYNRFHSSCSRVLYAHCSQCDYYSNVQSIQASVVHYTSCSCHVMFPLLCSYIWNYLQLQYLSMFKCINILTFLRYMCRGNKRCVTYQTSYTFQPTCCEGFASAIDAGVINRSAIDTDQLLKTQGCPVGQCTSD